MAKRSLNQKRTRYTNASAGSAASKFGQMIGTAFEQVVLDMIALYLAERYPDYELAQASDRRIADLSMFGGKKRKVDNTIFPIDSDDPVALMETKWLKDGRHHNDKGAWILQLREIRKRYPTIRSAGAILIGFWTNDVVVFLMNEGQVEAVRVATDEQVYDSLQPYLDDYLKLHRLELLVLDVERIRDKYERAWDLANFVQWMDERGELLPLVNRWLLLRHPSVPQLTGEEKIHGAIDKFLQPLSDFTPESWEVTIQLHSGNLIHQKLSDAEDLQAFALHYSDPQNIRERITPRKRKDKKADP